MTPADLDPEWCYGAIVSRDARFDGWFITGVTTTGIYCRPSCPAMTPKRTNVRFFRTAAAAQQAGLRACKRCRPDASPGSPEWNTRTDLVGRAMRLIADGVVDRHGVPGLASRLHYSERHLNRVLTEAVGAGPLALARSQRAQTARTLIETTDLPLTSVAFASGFTSVRQFNETVQSVFATSPRDLRHANRRAEPSPSGSITLRLPYRAPFAAGPLFSFLGMRAVPGVESWDAPTRTYERSLDLPHGPGTASFRPADGHVGCTLRLDDWRDLTTAVTRSRRLFDLDADPLATDAALASDGALEPLVCLRPGLRAPGHVDGFEVAIRAVLGQQVSVSGARTLAGRLVQQYGTALGNPRGTLTHLFPRPSALAGAADEHLAMPKSRRATVRALSTAVRDGTVVIDPGADPDQMRVALVALPGIGPWTAGYIAMRALGTPDVFLPTDLGVRAGAERAGLPSTPRDLACRAERWQPWRTYAVHHLWASLGRPEPDELEANRPEADQREANQREADQHDGSNQHDVMEKR